LRDNKLFIAYAPADDPKIAVAVVAENSLVMAGDIARKMMDYYLMPKNTPKKTDSMSSKVQWGF
jgi:penicillin-binding protein 2